MERGLIGDNMKVAMVAQPYDGLLPPNQNSIGLIAYNTAMELGRKVGLTLFGRRDSQSRVAADLPFRVSYVASRSDDVIQFVNSHYPRWARRFGMSDAADNYPGFARAVAKDLDRSDCSVVHVMNYWAWCRRLSAPAKNRRVVLEMQAEWLSQMDERSVSNQLEAADAVVAVSDHIARLFRATFPDYRGKVVTAYNGVDLDTFRPGESRGGRVADELPILFVGRVSPEKGVHTLIEAFARVAAVDKRARLQIVGARATLRPDFIVSISSDPLVRALNRFYGGSEGSDYQNHLDSLVRKLGLEDKVRFVGKVPHKDLPDWYRASSLVINPSLSESFGISIVEGMACGVPVVGTKVGGMLETIVDRQTGRLVEPERPDLLAEAVLSLLGSPTVGDDMGERGRERAVEHFSWGARADRLLSAYSMVCN